MTDRCFVDTNLLLYFHDASEPVKQAQAAAWLTALWQSRSGRLSYQVLQEFYAAATRKLKPGLPAEVARTAVRALLAWKPAVTDAATLDAAWSIQDRFGFAWWDALIVAAARRAGCRYLLTEDLSDGQVIDGLVVLDPFKRDPEAVLPSEPLAGP